MPPRCSTSGVRLSLTGVEVGGARTRRATPAARPPAVPEIPVDELASTTRFHRDRIGFRIDWVAEEIDLAGISRDACRLFLGGPRFREGRGNRGPVVTWLNLESVAEVDALHSDWRSRGATVDGAPETKPCGLHEFLAADADGNLIRVFRDTGTAASERAGAAPTGN